MSIEVAVLRDCRAAGIPRDRDFQDWVNAAARDLVGDSSVAIRIVDASESRRINRRWRGRGEPTNVLSFPADLPAPLRGQLDVVPLGDLVICASLVTSEAREQAKPVAAHWAHLTIHGVLHLLGHDHQNAAEAERMETLERNILAGFGISDPYDCAGDR